MSLDFQSAAANALVVRAALGNHAALDSLLRAVQQPLYDHIAFIMRDEDAASDVLQEVLLTICRSLIRLNHPALFRAWAFRIATRASVRAMRRVQRDDHVAVETIANSPASDADELFEPELVAMVPALVSELPAGCGLVIRLRYLEQLSLAEVAEALELPVGTVKSRASYGIELLRRRLVPTNR